MLNQQWEQIQLSFWAGIELWASGLQFQRSNRLITLPLAKGHVIRVPANQADELDMAEDQRLY